MKLHARNRGSMLVIALIFMTVVGALAAAMGTLAQGNLRGNRTYEQGQRALAAAETGLNFIGYRVSQLASQVVTDRGQLEGETADELWEILAARVYDMGYESQFLDDTDYPRLIYDGNGHVRRVELGRLPLGMPDDVGGDPNSVTFQVTLEQHPLLDDQGAIDLSIYDSAYYQRPPYNVSGGNNRFTTDGEPVSSLNPIINTWVRVTAVGQDGELERSVQMDYRIDKKVRYAILSRNRIMIGKNVHVKGTVGSRYTYTNFQHGHPVQMTDDFRGLTDTMNAKLDELIGRLLTDDLDQDNRLDLSVFAEGENADQLSFGDANGDGYIDAMDAFTVEFDANEDGVVDMSEFEGSDGQMVDPQLWQLINESKYPPGTQFNWDNHTVQMPGSNEWSAMDDDLLKIDVNDDYAKIRGQVVMKADQQAWNDGAAAEAGGFQWFYEGVISPDAYDDPTTFSAEDDKLQTFESSSFDVTAYRELATGTLAGQVATPEPIDESASPVVTEADQGPIESVPFNSPYPYDFYQRPVYENMVFRDVKIPKGSNALFRNCKFIGVTFVESTQSNEDPNFNYAGMQEPSGDEVYMITANVDGTDYSNTKAVSNNIRFDDCTFEGIVVTDTPSAYTHVRNKLQFTGKTSFDVEAPSLSKDQKALFKKSTILAPHFSVDIGTFTEGASPDEVVQLEGTIVAGVLDIRGQADVNGSIVTTYEPVVGEGPLAEGGNPAAFNTTFGYFASASGDSEAELPDEAGRITIRYDPNRAMPDGISSAIDLTGELDSYFEGGDQ